MKKKILLIRTFRPAGTGGPLPPLNLLYIASRAKKALQGDCALRLIDTGLDDFSWQGLKDQVCDFSPHAVCLSAMVWEADILHRTAELIKSVDKNTLICVEGQLANLAGKYLLSDENIDFVVLGEGDITVSELLMKGCGDGIEGLIFRKNSEIVCNQPRPPIEDLDNFMISEEAWDLIDARKYSKHPGWNGSLKEGFYMPVLTSRGCPFECTFCCNRDVSGSRFRMRSAENVASEILFLREKYNAREIHIFDTCFNFDRERAKQICRLISDSGKRVSLAFPHGIRADITDAELLGELRKAGTYKITYGIETASQRLQKQFKKNLNLERVKEIITLTHKTGIIVSGYFMLGFPGETRDEMLRTIEFARDSDLDLAYFFKYADFYGIKELYKTATAEGSFDRDRLSSCLDLCYYSSKTSHTDMSSDELNAMILKAQEKFYLKPGRLLRYLIKSPRKSAFLKNCAVLSSMLLEAFLVRNLAKKEKNG